MGASRGEKLGRVRQEPQLPQRDCVMLRVIEYFAKSLKVIQGRSRFENDTLE